MSRCRLIRTSGRSTSIEGRPPQRSRKRSTTAVLVSIVLIGAFLLVVDLVVGYVMKTMHVLPK